MVRRTSVDGRIITAGWYAKLASMVTLSLLDRTLDQRRWPNHHRWMVCRTRLDGRIITTGWYVRPVSMVT
jgi:hypothetical protein